MKKLSLKTTDQWTLVLSLVTLLLNCINCRKKQNFIHRWKLPKEGVNFTDHSLQVQIPHRFISNLRINRNENIFFNLNIAFLLTIVVISFSYYIIWSYNILAPWEWIQAFTIVLKRRKKILWPRLIQWSNIGISDFSKLILRFRQNSREYLYVILLF